MSAFQQSKLRVHRAEERLSDLELEIKLATKAALQVAAEQANFEANKKPLEEFSGQLWEETRLLVSEFALHARVALDYLVFNLAWNDSGVEQKGTQFPIDECPERFAGHILTRLKGLTDEHIAMVEKFQPYNGFRLHPLLVLNRLSNRDKHREFVHISFLGMSRTDPNLHTAPPTVGITQMEVNAGRTFQVLLHGTGPEVEDLPKALADILSLVKKVIDYFEGVVA
ncbi:MAG TPA: hypothetical protein VNF27_06870 [Candidatus Binataceae bacterium]|nr:hypothetical protein [Candidatus Binataceae bacterium]